MGLQAFLITLRTLLLFYSIGLRIHNQSTWRQYFHNVMKQLGIYIDKYYNVFVLHNRDLVLWSCTHELKNRMVEVESQFRKLCGPLPLFTVCSIKTHFLTSCPFGFLISLRVERQKHFWAICLTTVTVKKYYFYIYLNRISSVSICVYCLSSFRRAQCHA